MQLPGIITINPQDATRITHVASMMGTSFMEENWYITWLEVLEKQGVSRDRRLTLMQALFHDEITSFAPYQGYYALQDMTAATGVYLKSELGSTPITSIEDSCHDMFFTTATPQELRVLQQREQDMEPISVFNWAEEFEGTHDFIYFFAWAVDPAARGTHALTRLVTPFFAYADEHHLSCYLECYSDKLQHIYEHLGFSVIDVIASDEFSITERRMVRRPRDL